MVSTIHDLFGHVYLINLEKSKERLKAALENCTQIGLSFERFEAFDGDKDKVPFNGLETAGWSPRAAALCKTTIAILMQAKKEKHKSIFIMEDDINFGSNFNERISSIKIPEDFELFHLRVTNARKKRWVSPGVMNIRGGWCCQAYAVHSHIYDLMIEELSKFDRPLDQVTSEIMARGNSYATSSNLTLHPPNYSTLRNKFLDHRYEG